MKVLAQTRTDLRVHKMKKYEIMRKMKKSWTEMKQPLQKGYG